MSHFDDKSRYAALTPVLITDGRGRTVEAIPPAPAPDQELRGTHVLRQGERPDHLATLYLADSAAYWRIAEMNDAMSAEVLTELREIQIPSKRK